VESIIRELELAQRDTAKSSRFEHAVADAFEFLGFDVQRKGQAGSTDVIVDSRLGTDHFRSIVDAKASGSGKVPEAQINWAAISSHRAAVAADYAVLVGESFAGGNLLRFAVDYRVALLDVSSLSSVVRLHDRTPFPAEALRILLATPGPAEASVGQIRELSDATDRHWELVANVVRLADGLSRSDPPIPATLDRLHGALLWALIVGQEPDTAKSPRPTEQDIRDAVAFLASRAVGILRPGDPVESAGYRLMMSPKAALQRLRAMQDSIQRMSTANSASGQQTSYSNLLS
jgi:hypothetical protein